jgi:hypothetical protein
MVNDRLCCNVAVVVADDDLIVLKSDPEGIAKSPVASAGLTLAKKGPPSPPVVVVPSSQKLVFLVTGVSSAA